MITKHVSAQSLGMATPDELAMLQKVFDHISAESGIEKKSPRGEGLAATMLRQFQSGVRREDDLGRLLAKIDIL